MASLNTYPRIGLPPELAAGQDFADCCRGSFCGQVWWGMQGTASEQEGQVELSSELLFLFAFFSH